MKIKCTPEERKLLDEWPTVTDQDFEQMNDLFTPYIFFRPGEKEMELWTSCCRRKERMPFLRRTDFPEERALLDACTHNLSHACPWCGRTVTMKDLRKSGKRKTLREYRLVMLLHAKGNALYCDALCLRKAYETEQQLAEAPEYDVYAGYRFSHGDVMEVNYYCWDFARVTHEAGTLGRKKKVTEPFLLGSICWYRYESYYILNREELTNHPNLKYCGFFSHWQYRPGGARGYAARFSDFVSFMTAYCIYPRQVEMLVKAGLYEPLEDLIFDRKKNADAINWSEPDIRKAMVLSRQDLSELVALKPSMEAMKARALARRWFGERWSVRDTLNFYNEFSGPPAVDFLRLCRAYALKPGKAYDYLMSQACYDPDLPWISMGDLLVLYWDYLDAAYLLGRCMEHSKVLFPRDLLQAHDEEVELLQTEQSAIRDESASTLIAESAKERREKYSFELDGLRIVFPMTAAEIKREGRVLNHCVGGYAQRHMKNVLTILFLRKTSAPHEPYVTIEMHGNRMMQCHGYQNDVGKKIKPQKLHTPTVTWETDGALHTVLSMLNTGESPNEDAAVTLSEILQDNVPDKYSLSPRACLGILRRASMRGKELPAILRRALEQQAGSV